MSKQLYINKHSVIYGDVKLGDNCSVWPGAVLRADGNEITVGGGSNIQDNVTIHADAKNKVEIGKNTSIGHGAIIHGCKIGNNCLIGMGAIILSGAVVEDNSIVGAGALVSEGKKVPRGTVVVGIPAKELRKVTKEDLELIRENALEYIKLKDKYLKK